ncbi:hypothetical protein CDAR_523241 [Caerostris darwini]|uniref:Uncharacterized protein n=1 Tax=Caerostris darwini TaxID=1538125 RepID=A0AAV4U918_9ARAC|nr:hypothetical protein CDAR_523241 [Caerostris darwini]
MVKANCQDKFNELEIVPNIANILMFELIKTAKQNRNRPNILSASDDTNLSSLFTAPTENTKEIGLSHNFEPPDRTVYPSHNRSPSEIDLSAEETTLSARLIVFSRLFVSRFTPQKNGERIDPKTQTSPLTLLCHQVPEVKSFCFHCNRF